MIVALTIRSGLEGFKVPMILRTIVKDATVYFLVIFTSHFVLGMTLLFARVRISIIGFGGRGDIEISPARRSTLASCVSTRFETHQ